MSKTGAIYIEPLSYHSNNFIDILNILNDNGWSVDKEGAISFMINGSFDWQSESFIEIEKVLWQLKNSIDSKLETSVDLIYKDGVTVIGLLFTNENYIMITITESLKRVKDNSTIDFNFYLKKISPLYKYINEQNIKCTYD